MEFFVILIQSRTMNPKQIGANVIDLIGNTPLVRLRNIGCDVAPVQMLVKAEWFNPGGSVKDRPAREMILEGERSGKLTRNKTILDSSSGNTAIAYAMIAASLGYRAELVMPKNVSDERKKILDAFGALIVFTDPLEGSDGAIREAHRRYGEDPDKYFMPDQYNNEHNPLAHEKTTAQEIWRQTQGRVTHLVAAIGTGGTVMGTGRGLRVHNRDVQVVAVEPAGSLHGLEGMKHMASSIVPGIYKDDFPDRKIPVETEDAYEMVRRLSREEGIFVGQSSGAVLWAALQIARELKRDGRDGIIVAIFPDGGDKYLSTRVWE